MIITTSAEKGGVGKSTVAMILASELHRMEYAVLVVDTDPQGTVREWADIASDSCESFPAVITMGDNLSRQLPGIADRYDVTIVDCAGTDNRALRRALSISDLALVPCGASAPEMFGIKRTLRIIDEARDANPHLTAPSSPIKSKEGPSSVPLRLSN